MRVDVRPGKAGYVEPGLYRVYLNDVEVTNQCIMADDAYGEVLLYLHRDGRPYLNVTKTAAVTEVRRGTVCILARD